MFAQSNDLEERANRLRRIVLSAVAIVVGLVGFFFAGGRAGLHGGAGPVFSYIGWVTGGGAVAVVCGGIAARLGRRVAGVTLVSAALSLVLGAWVALVFTTVSLLLRL